MSSNSFKILKARLSNDTGPLPSNTTRPAITGTFEVGEIGTVTPGTWENVTDPLSYRWFADGVLIFGATGLTYTFTAAEAGKTVTVEESATNAAGTVTAFSDGVGPITSSGEANVAFGEKTLRGHGGYDVGIGTTISSGNTGGVWAITSGKLVLAGTYGAAPPALSFPYTLGLSNGATLNVVSAGAHAYTIAPNPATDSGDTNQLNAVLNSGSVNYGDTIILRDGTTFGLNDSGDINDLPKLLSVSINAAINFGVRSGGPSAPTHQGWSAPTFSGTTHELPGWVTVRPETQLGATWTRLEVLGDKKLNQYLKFDGIDWVSFNVGKTNSASTAALWVKADNPSGNLAVKWVAVTNCHFRSRIEPGSDAMMTAILFKQTTNESGNFYVYNNTFNTVFNGIVRQGHTVEIVGNDMRYAYNDAVKGIVFNGLHSWNIIRDKTYLPTAHGDYFQEQWETVAPGTYTGSVYVGNIMYIGDHITAGQVGGQGVFISGAQAGVIIDGIIVKGNVYVDAMVRGISIARGSNPDVQNNVIVKDQADTYPVGTPRILFAQTEGGVAKNNTIWSSTTSGPTLIDTAAGVITPPTDTGNYAVNNADIPAAYASPVFGPDYTVAQLRAAFTSKVGGPLDTTPAKGIGVGTTYVDFVNRTTNFPA